MPYYSGEPIRRGPIELCSPDLPGFAEARAQADVDISHWYERAATDASLLYFAVALSADRTPVGEVMVYDINRETGRALLHVHLFRTESRDQGLGESALRAVVEHAFRHEKLRELTLVLGKANFAARRCYAKCGFQQVDRLEGDESQLVISLARDEWRRMVDDEEW
jgi:RimJ/RimL family protein N-acetyltransferase